LSNSLKSRLNRLEANPSSKPKFSLKAIREAEKAAAEVEDLLTVAYGEAGTLEFQLAEARIKARESAKIPPTSPEEIAREKEINALLDALYGDESRE